jgi:hypothetical protein
MCLKVFYFVAAEETAEAAVFTAELAVEFMIEAAETVAFVVLFSHILSFNSFFSLIHKVARANSYSHLTNLHMFKLCL